MPARARPGGSPILRRGALLVAILAGCADLSCASGAEKIVRRSVPATIDETIGAFEDPETQRRLKKLIDLPDVQEAARRLAQGLTEGALDGLTDEERIKRAQKLSEEYVTALTKAVGEGLQRDIDPAVAGTAQHAVERALAPVLSPQTRQGAAALVETLTRRTVRTLSESLRDDMGPAMQSVLERNLGPALQRVIEDNLGPALRKTIEADVAPALRNAFSEEVLPAAGKLSREVSREAVLGMIDALVTLEEDERLKGYNDRFWGRLNDTLSQGQRVGEILVWLFALVIIVLGLLLVRSIIVRRHLEAERERSERMLIGILHELQRGGAVRVDAVVEKVRQRDPELAASKHLSHLIERAVAVTRDIFDGKPDLDGKPDEPPKS